MKNKESVWAVFALLLTLGLLLFTVKITADYNVSRNLDRIAKVLESRK